MLLLIYKKSPTSFTSKRDICQDTYVYAIKKRKNQRNKSSGFFFGSGWPVHRRCQLQMKPVRPALQPQLLRKR